MPDITNYNDAEKVMQRGMAVCIVCLNAVDEQRTPVFDGEPDDSVLILRFYSSAALAPQTLDTCAGWRSKADRANRKTRNGGMTPSRRVVINDKDVPDNVIREQISLVNARKFIVLPVGAELNWLVLQEIQAIAATSQDWAIQMELAVEERGEIVSEFACWHSYQAHPAGRKQLHMRLPTNVGQLMMDKEPAIRLSQWIVGNPRHPGAHRIAIIRAIAEFGWPAQVPLMGGWRDKTRRSETGGKANRGGSMQLERSFTQLCTSTEAALRDLKGEAAEVLRLAFEIVQAEAHNKAIGDPEAVEQALCAANDGPYLNEYILSTVLDWLELSNMRLADSGAAEHQLRLAETIARPWADGRLRKFENLLRPRLDELKNKLDPESKSYDALAGVLILKQLREFETEVDLLRRTRLVETADTSMLLKELLRRVLDRRPRWRVLLLPVDLARLLGVFTTARIRKRFASRTERRGS